MTSACVWELWGNQRTLRNPTWNPAVCSSHDAAVCSTLGSSRNRCCIFSTLRPCVHTGWLHWPNHVTFDATLLQWGVSTYAITTFTSTIFISNRLHWFFFPAWQYYELLCVDSWHIIQVKSISILGCYDTKNGQGQGGEYLCNALVKTLYTVYHIPIAVQLRMYNMWSSTY